MTELLTSPTNIIIIVTTIATIAVAYMYRRSKTPSTSKVSIDILRPRDKRAFTMPAIEHEISLLCPKKDGVPWRFYKSGPGWSFPNGVTKFFGIEGTAYTAIIKDDKPITIKLYEGIKILFGDEEYNKMPKNLRDIVEKHRFGVIIYPEKIPEADKITSLSAANVDDENDQKALDSLANDMKDKGEMNWMAFFQGGAIFGLIIYILANLHVLPVVIK